MPIRKPLLAALLAGALAACTFETTRTIYAVKPAPGPDTDVRITEAYARLVARDAGFWAWPLVNVWNRRLNAAQVKEPGLVGGVVPVSPLNRLAMLHDTIDPAERSVACPNQDVVYGAAMLALDQGPVVVQVPDFGGRFWTYQVADLRTDAAAQLGAVHGTEPGFYLLVAPAWEGELPAGITRVFRSRTNTAFLAPCVFQLDDPADKRAVQELIAGIDAYPLAEFDGQVKRRDWSKLPEFPGPKGGADEQRFVFPETFFDQLPEVLADAPPLPGEDARYAQVLAVIAAAKKDPALMKAMVDEVGKAQRELVDPLLEFRSFGVPLPGNWSTINNGASWGTDYFTRTAVAKSNIFVSRREETKSFYLDLDADGRRLDGGKDYTVTFPAGDTPPVDGFWSLTLYDEHHFFAPNELGRYSVGTKNKDLKLGPDGSLTIYVQPEPPPEAKRSNWLPAPDDEPFSLYLRAYGPRPPAMVGDWSPPPAVRVE